jgi:hypothetical protein
MMERLKAVINQHGRWSGLETYIERINAHMETDFSLALENAKALLESVGKEVCDQRGKDLGANPTVNKVLKTAFLAIGHNGEDMITQISTSLGNIGQQMGELRNEIGATAHGRTMAEIKERNDRVDEMTREFLIDTTEIVAMMLIRRFEASHPLGAPVPIEQQILEYDDHPEFNEFWDEAFGGCEMGTYSFTASEILYGVDPMAYRVECEAYAKDEVDA